MLYMYPHMYDGTIGISIRDEIPGYETYMVHTWKYPHSDRL